jgi:hypothetical protein
MNPNKKPPQSVTPYTRSIEEVSSPSKSIAQSTKVPEAKKDAALLYH